MPATFSFSSVGCCYIQSRNLGAQHKEGPSSPKFQVTNINKEYQKLTKAFIVRQRITQKSKLEWFLNTICKLKAKITNRIPLTEKKTL